MSSVSPSRVLVSHRYGEDRFIPYSGEIIMIRLPQDLRGPGSELTAATAASTRDNDQLAVVLGASYDTSHAVFNVFPITSYSSTDPVTHLSSTSWLINEPDHFQQLHIPVPYEEDPSQPHPPFPNPAQFGDPLEICGWKNSGPSWVLAVPQAAEVKYSMTFKSFDPPVKLNREEYWRLREYNKPSPSPVTEVGQSPITLDSFPGRDDDYDYDDDYDDDDDDWEDNMDPITFLRYFAAGYPVLAEVVQKHDEKLRERFDQGITSWIQGVQSATS